MAMNPQEPSVSHIEIYHKLGTLEGKLDALITRTTEYRNDLQTAFERLTKVENRMAWAMGAAVVISTLVPILINIISSGFHMRFEQKDLPPKASIINRI
jgi:hypothetical protein